MKIVLKILIQKFFKTTLQMDLKKLYKWKNNSAPSTLSDFNVSNYKSLWYILMNWLDFPMFRNLCHFPKFMFSENATCVKTEGGAVIQTLFSDRTNVFLAMTTILFRFMANYFYTWIRGNVKIVHFPHFHDISYEHHKINITIMILTMTLTLTLK